jgi:hypothetical protein
VEIANARRARDDTEAHEYFRPGFLVHLHDERERLRAALDDGLEALRAAPRRTTGSQ